MTPSFARTVAPDLPSLSRLMQEAGAFLEDHGAPPEAVFAANLALEEMITNTIKYGFPGTAPRPLEVRLELRDKEFELTIADDARPFDPFTMPDPDLSLPADRRPIGGLGIHLVRSMMTSCSHRPEAGRNVVRLTKAWE
jgi:serine/threonine-protein kinase RsbW